MLTLFHASSDYGSSFLVMSLAKSFIFRMCVGLSRLWRPTKAQRWQVCLPRQDRYQKNPCRVLETWCLTVAGGLPVAWHKP